MALIVYSMAATFVNLTTAAWLVVSPSNNDDSNFNPPNSYLYPAQPGVIPSSDENSGRQERQR